MPHLSALVAMSSFKGSLSNRDACDIVGEALEKAQISVQKLPIGDGGSGTVEAVFTAFGGTFTSFDVSGPLNQKVRGRVLCLPDSDAPDTLYIESPETCGHSLVRPEDRDAMRASSFGLGELLALASQRWKATVKKIFVGLGDSATSDMGMGMLRGLGYEFFDQSGHSIWGNATGLRQIHQVKLPEPSPLAGIKIVVLCDVLNSVCGNSGSAQVFSRQKGASQGQVALIADGMENFAAIIQKTTGQGVRMLPMTGSAGGLGAAFLGFFDAELVLGAQFLLDWIGFDRMLLPHNFLITGEGKTDAQTLAGKAPYECFQRAERLSKPALIISGALGEGIDPILRSEFLAGCQACGDRPTARDALFEKSSEIFDDADFRARLATHASPLSSL